MRFAAEITSDNTLLRQERAGVEPVLCCDRHAAAGGYVGRGTGRRPRAAISRVGVGGGESRSRHSFFAAWKHSSIAQREPAMRAGSAISMPMGA
jgi:hypothetical protein